MKNISFFLTLAFCVACSLVQASDPLVDRLFENDPRLRELRKRYEQQLEQNEHNQEENRQADVAEMEPQRAVLPPVSRRQPRVATQNHVEDEAVVPHVKNKRRRRHYISQVQPIPSQNESAQSYDEPSCVEVNTDDDNEYWCMDYPETAPLCCYEPRFCGSLTLGAEILYWKACSELLGAGSRTSRFLKKTQFVMTSMEPSPAPALVASFDSGVIFSTEANRHTGTGEISDDWHVGVRLGGRYQTPCRSWDVGLRWTYLNPEESRSHKAGAREEIIVPALFEGNVERDTTIFSSPDSGETYPTVPVYPTIQKAKDRYDLCFHLIDFEISRPLCLCDSLYIRPHLGAKIAVIDEKLHTHFEGQYCIRVSEEDKNIEFTGHAHRKYCFTGAGPRIGVNLQWDMFCGVGFYGNVATAITAGGREACQSFLIERMSVAFDGTPDEFGDVKDKIHLVDDTCIQSITDVEVGIAWYSCYCGGRYGFRMKLGWDTHYVMDVTSVYSSRVATSGLTFGASTHF